MMAAFSSDAQRCMEQHVESENIFPTPVNSLCEIYELDRCDAWIKTNKLLKVSYWSENEVMWPITL